MEEILRTNSYYDGHYPEPMQSVEEIEEELKELQKKEQALTEWPKSN